MAQHEFDPILRKLTTNAGITLRHRAHPVAGECLGRVHTGLGKYTALAAGAVISNLRVNGIVEEQRGVPYLTPLGVRVALYLAQNWDDAKDLLRDPIPPRLR